jgi:hypothetical protein
LADKIKHVEDHHLLELIRETHKPAASETGLPEPIPGVLAAASLAGSQEGPQFLSAEPPEPFAVPIPVAAEQHHEQEDYLWGV